MVRNHLRMALLCLSLFTSVADAANVKGIYLTQYSLENTGFLNYLIRNAKAAGIDTFVIDLETPSKKYQQNIQLLTNQGIKYVARIAMFPNGGTASQIKNPEIWQKKYQLVQQAVLWGAKEIQLDYIRYNSKQKPSTQNAKDILAIISWYKNKLVGQNIPLQVDVFGVASYGESKYIGQNIIMFSQSVDAICPMVYPSHYVPFALHYKTPYKTIADSLFSIKKQFNNQMPIRMIPYIELSNYHYRMSRDQKIAYIQEQMKAVEHANVEGWYAWSPHNRYENLFFILQKQKSS